MTSPDHDSQLSPLPVRPRPAAGETASSYVRRLAIANHLRPSYLHSYLAGPPGWLHGIKPERLAALSGRTVAGLDRALTGLTRQPRKPPSRRTAPAVNRPGLFTAIRHDAQDGQSIRALAARHHVHRRTIRHALADPVPPPRKQMPPRGSALDRLHDQIAAMLTAEPGMTIRHVWERLLDEHDAGVSYGTVSNYLTRLRPGNPDRNK